MFPALQIIFGLCGRGGRSHLQRKLLDAIFLNRNHLRQLHCQLLQATRVVSMRITMRHPNNSCQLVSEIHITNDGHSTEYSNP